MAAFRCAGVARTLPRLNIGGLRVRPTAHARAQPPAGVFHVKSNVHPASCVVRDAGTCPGTAACRLRWQRRQRHVVAVFARQPGRSEEHTSELQSLMRISYAVFCLKKKTKKRRTTDRHT